MTKTQWVIDADAFITPKRSYYPFDYCPAFWDALRRGYSEGRVYSIDRVFDQISAKEDELSTWARGLPSNFFRATRTASTAQHFAPLMEWVEAQEQFRDAAKAEFADDTNADGWLIASAREHGMTVVTLEVFNSEVKKRVPIPNVCQKFDVPYTGVFEMVRELQPKFVLEA